MPFTVRPKAPIHTEKSLIDHFTKYYIFTSQRSCLLLTHSAKRLCPTNNATNLTHFWASFLLLRHLVHLLEKDWKLDCYYQVQIFSLVYRRSLSAKLDTHQRNGRLPAVGFCIKTLVPVGSLLIVRPFISVLYLFGWCFLISHSRPCAYRGSLSR